VKISIENIGRLEEAILSLKEIEKADLPKEYQERLAELEVKMSKLWNMLTTVSAATGEPKLSKFGRKFGGGGFQAK